MSNIPNKLPSIHQALSWNEYLSVSEYTTRRLTFGKYINVMIKDLPYDYLEWGVLNLSQPWSDYFIREWKKRNPDWRKRLNPKSTKITP
jgi:hypothetical protein